VNNSSKKAVAKISSTLFLIYAWLVQLRIPGFTNWPHWLYIGIFIILSILAIFSLSWFFKANDKQAIVSDHELNNYFTNYGWLLFINGVLFISLNWLPKIIDFNTMTNATLAPTDLWYAMPLGIFYIILSVGGLALIKLSKE
jgi:hypothetical protein